MTAFMGLVAEKGYAAASIQEIAQAAGLAPGLVHYHFENKQEILVSLLERLESILDARLEKRLEEFGPREDAEGEIDALIDAFLELDRRADRLALGCWTMISNEAAHNPELAKAFGQSVRKYRERLVRLLARLPEMRGAGQGRQLETASALLAAVHGMFLMASAAPGLIPRGSAASNVKRMARGLWASPRPSPAPGPIRRRSSSIARS